MFAWLGQAATPAFKDLLPVIQRSNLETLTDLV